MIALTQLLDAPWTKPRIAVLEITGPIGVQVRAPEMIRTIKALREDRRVQAVVVEVDSPGGSAPVSDAIFRALQRLSAKKPTIAFVGSGALSGGYLIACGARQIIALPTSLVGSIGVIFMRPVVQELMQKVGVRMIAHHQGHLKAMFQPWREPTAEEDQKVEQLTDEYYEWFVGSVAAARNLPVESVRQYATGEMFSASRAKEIGLVDELGDFEQAVDRAREAAHVLETPRIHWVRPRRPLMERLLSRGMTAMTDAVVARIEERIFPRIEFRG
jgi:protease-4